jgi:hypothetical protein
MMSLYYNMACDIWLKATEPMVSGEQEAVSRLWIAIFTVQRLPLTAYPESWSSNERNQH